MLAQAPSTLACTPVRASARKSARSARVSRGARLCALASGGGASGDALGRRAAAAAGAAALSLGAGATDARAGE